MMDAKNLSWNQIKELAQMAIDSGNEFSLDVTKDGDVNINISKSSIPYYPITINQPFDFGKPYVTWEDNNTSKINPDINYTKVTC